MLRVIEVGSLKMRTESENRRSESQEIEWKCSLRWMIGRTSEKKGNGGDKTLGGSSRGHGNEAF